eukprot:959055_1
MSSFVREGKRSRQVLRSDVPMPLEVNRNATNSYPTPPVINEPNEPPLKKQKRAAKRKIKQIIMFKEYSKFGLAHKVGKVSLAFNMSYPKTSLPTAKLCKIICKSGLFELPILQQMAITFSFLSYLPRNLDAETLIPRYYGGDTLNGVGTVVLHRFFAQYNETIKNMPTEILINPNASIPVYAGHDMLCHLDTIFKHKDLKYLKMDMLKYLCYRKWNVTSKRCDWDRQYIYDHFWSDALEESDSDNSQQQEATHSQQQEATHSQQQEATHSQQQEATHSMNSNLKTANDALQIEVHDLHKTVQDKNKQIAKLQNFRQLTDNKLCEMIVSRFADDPVRHRQFGIKLCKKSVIIQQAAEKVNENQVFSSTLRKIEKSNLDINGRITKVIHSFQYHMSERCMNAVYKDIHYIKTLGLDENGIPILKWIKRKDLKEELYPGANRRNETVQTHYSTNPVLKYRYLLYDEFTNPHSALISPGEAIKLHTKVLATSPMTVGAFEHHVRSALQPMDVIPVLGWSADSLPVKNYPTFRSMTVMSIRHLSFIKQGESDKILFPVCSIAGQDDKNIAFLNRVFDNTMVGLSQTPDLEIFWQGTFHNFHMDKAVAIMIADGKFLSAWLNHACCASKTPKALPLIAIKATPTDDGYDEQLQYGFIKNGYYIISTLKRHWPHQSHWPSMTVTEFFSKEHDHKFINLLAHFSLIGEKLKGIARDNVTHAHTNQEMSDKEIRKWRRDNALDKYQLGFIDFVSESKLNVPIIVRFHGALRGISDKFCQWLSFMFINYEEDLQWMIPYLEKNQLTTYGRSLSKCLKQRKYFRINTNGKMMRKIRDIWNGIVPLFEKHMHRDSEKEAKYKTLLTVAWCWGCEVVCKALGFLATDTMDRKSTDAIYDTRIKDAKQDLDQYYQVMKIAVSPTIHEILLCSALAAKTTKQFAETKKISLCYKMIDDQAGELDNFSRKNIFNNNVNKQLISVHTQQRNVAFTRTAGLMTSSISLAPKHVTKKQSNWLYDDPNVYHTNGWSTYARHCLNKLREGKVGDVLSEFGKRNKDKSLEAMAKCYDEEHGEIFSNDAVELYESELLQKEIQSLTNSIKQKGTSTRKKRHKKALVSIV